METILLQKIRWTFPSNNTVWIFFISETFIVAYINGYEWRR